MSQKVNAVTHSLRVTSIGIAQEPTTHNHKQEPRDAITMLSTATFQQEYELQDLPTYVSKDHLLNELLMGTLVAAAAISLLFCGMISVVTLLVPP